MPCSGGSSRQPAHYWGLVGMKPSWGRVSRAACMTLRYSLDTVGPLTRRVEDSALLMRILAGADQRDPTASALPVEAYLKEARSDRQSVVSGKSLYGRVGSGGRRKSKNNYHNVQ